MDIISLLFSVFLLLSITNSSGYEFRNDMYEPYVTHVVWMNISVGGKFEGQFEIGLFGLDVPKTVKNFKMIAKDSMSMDDDVTYRLKYKGTKFHRIVPQKFIQGGDIINNDGTGGDSWYGGPFSRENFNLKNYGAGWLAMVNNVNDGKITNDSRFYILTDDNASSDMDGSNVVFGKIIKGVKVINKIKNVQLDRNFRPVRDVVIEDCGAEQVDIPFPVTLEAAADADF